MCVVYVYHICVSQCEWRRVHCMCTCHTGQVLATVWGPGRGLNSHGRVARLALLESPVDWGLGGGRPRDRRGRSREGRGGEGRGGEGRRDVVALCV